MNEWLEEYGSTVLSAFAAIVWIALLVRSVFSGGVLGELLLQLGNMAC